MKSLAELKNKVKQNLPVILGVAVTVAATAVSKYNEKRRPYAIIQLEVVKSLPKRMKSGDQLKYVGENGDYQFLIQHKRLGTLFED